MRKLVLVALLFRLISQLAAKDKITVHIPTSQLISIAQKVARDEGYDIQNEDVYYFDLLTTADGKPRIEGYTSVGFYINGIIRSGISINETTGQVLDATTCEFFDYLDLKPFSEKMLRLTKSKLLSPEELAKDVGCKSLTVLNQSVLKKNK
jgi:hypothetical protein